jgi:sugar O-acyltransferase (sialic acid O-acetyltransferase NeuD family)
MKPGIILIGGGGHCRSVIDVIEQEERFSVCGIIDREENLGSYVLGYKIIGSDSLISELRTSVDYAFVTMGQINSPERRLTIFRQLTELGYRLPVIISPRAYVSRHAKIGKGTVVMHDALVNAGAVIGENCIINTKALIEHDTVIEDHCHISTGAVVNGGVKVGRGSFFGSNAVSRQSAEIPSESFVKAGSVFK